MTEFNENRDLRPSQIFEVHFSATQTEFLIAINAGQQRPRSTNREQVSTKLSDMPIPPPSCSKLGLGFRGNWFLAAT